MPAVVSPVPVPLAGEAVPAGFPATVGDGHDDGFSLDRHIIRNPAHTFIVTVAGDSMEGAGIFHGDWMVVDRSLEPRDGDIVVAVLDGELTVKRLTWHAGVPRLHAENPRYPDFTPGEHADLVIWGVVTGSFHPQPALDRRGATAYGPAPQR
ncbi:S24 family peptidase [Bifidobacterium leontopitheci]